MIFKYLQSTFTRDRIRDLEVTWEYIDDEKPFELNNYRIIIKVNIDGKYKFKYNKKIDL